MPPAYTSICTAPTNSACCRMKMQATTTNDRRRKSAECTGLRAATTAIADASARTAKIANSQPAVPVSSAPPSIAPYPLSTTVKGFTFGASRQSVSFRMSR